MAVAGGDGVFDGGNAGAGCGAQSLNRLADHAGQAHKATDDFEVGKFRTLKRTAGHVEITLAVDPFVQEFLDRDGREDLLAAVAGALGYFEETFGPYPLDQLTV